MASTGEAALLERAEVNAPSHAAQRRGHSWTWLLPALVVAAVVVPKLWFLDAAVFGQDESILLIYPEQLRDGRIPNLDFFTVYGPGNYLTLAGVYALFGQSLLAERLVGIAYQAAVVAGVMAITRRRGRGPSLVAGMLSALLLCGPESIALSWMGGLALTLGSLALLHRGGNRAVLVAGVLAGVVTFWRIEMGVLAVAALPLLWRDWPSLRRYLLGAVLGATPTIVHLAIAGRQMLHNVFLDRMGVNAQVDWSILGTGVFVTAGFLVAAALGLFAAAVVRRDPVYLSSALLVAGMLPQAFQRVDFIHIVVMTGSVAFPLAVAPLLGRIRTRPVRQDLIAVALAAAVVTLAAGAAVSPNGQKVTHEGRSLYVANAQQVEDLVAAVIRHVPAGSRVFVGSSDMSVATANMIQLYQLLPEYRNDFYFIELHVGVAERAGSPLVDDIRSADALVLTDHPDLRLLYPHFPAGSEAANRAVARWFCPVERLEGVTIYLRNGASASCRQP